MKKVFASIPDVAHKFAERSQPEGRCGNVFFYGDKIYSYGRHYCIGEFLEVNGETCILIDNRGYSSSTQDHIRIVRNATSHYKQYYSMDTDLLLVRSQILSAYKSLLSARKKELYLPTILRKFYGLISSPFFTANNKEDQRFLEIEKIYNSVNNPEYLEMARVEEAKRKALAKKKEALRLIDDLADFKAYKLDYIHNQSEDYLRISKDGLRVETSQGARVDIEGARVLYTLIKNGRDIKGHKIGNYTVISLNGVLTIGCHKINTDSMREIGEQIIK
jgi:hypothetical protein